MNSNKTREGPKTAGGGGGLSKTAKQSSANKSDSKSDKADLIAKKTPTPEQMQIARIIDTHRIEDPELLKKMKQVQEVTGASEDDASMALHSREYDVEQAITLLTEGGSESLDAEWEQAGGKKRKPKVPASKLDVVKERSGVELGEKGARERSEKRDGKSERGADRRDGEGQGDGASFEFRGRGSGRGGRGGRGGPRGRGISNRTDVNTENEQSAPYDAGSRGRFMNGPGRGGRGRGTDRDRGDSGAGRGRGGSGRDRDGTRTFASRARGARDGDFSNHPIDVWENSQADPKSDKKPLKVEQWDEFPSAEDWDNEEYTGSLAESKVFTPSTQTSSVPASMTDGTNGVANTNSSLTETTASGNHIGAAGNVGSIIGGLNGAGPGGVVSGQSLDVNMIFTQQQKTQKLSGSSTTTGGNPGANILASLQSSATLQSSYSNATQQGQVASNQALPQRQKVQRPQQRMPSSGVEMPEDAVGKLDVQFGGLEFGSTGSTFNSVVQHGVPKGAGDMLYGSSMQQQKIDTYSGDSDLQSKNISSVPVPEPSAFQGRNQQQGMGPSLVGNESLNSKASTMSPQSADGHNAMGSSISSQQKPNNNAGNKQSQQQSQYTNSANSGSAFVSYPGKGAPGFPAPGFPPVTQSHTGNVGAVPYMPGGPVYGSQQNPILLTQPGGYNVGNMSSYGNQPIAAGPVQMSGAMSQGMPSQNLGQMASTYGTSTGYPYNPSSIPASSSNSNQYGGYGKLQNSVSSPPGQHQTLKETLNDTINVSASSAGQHGSATTLQSTTSTTSSSKTSGIPSSGVGSSTVSSKVPGNSGATGSGSNTGLPPGMMLQPQYIMNQGVPMYQFQGPTMYPYDENSVQFLPRLPHQIPAGYFDASGAYVSADAQMRNTNYSFVAPTGGVPSTGRTDGSSMQSYQVTDGRFPRSDSSTGSPVPSNLPGQTTQPLQYNPLQYVYYGNPGGYPYGPPPMYQTTAMGTPTNPTSGTGTSQYGNKNYFQNPYLTSYDTSGVQGGLSGGVADFGKNSYQSGVGGVNASGKGPGSSSNAQAQDMNSSMYGNKGHLNNMKNFDKQSYGGTTGSPYNSLPQQSNNMGGAGMGTPYNVYMPATQPVLPTLFTQDGVSGQRQGTGQPKGGNKQYGNQQYWAGGN